MDCRVCWIVCVLLWYHGKNIDLVLMSLSPVFFEEDPITKFPSVDVLNRLILTWDFYRDVTDDRNTSIEDTTTLVNKSIAIVYQGLRRAARDASNLSSGQSSPYDEPPPTLTLQKLKVFYKTCEEYILRWVWRGFVSFFVSSIEFFISFFIFFAVCFLFFSPKPSSLSSARRSARCLPQNKLPSRYVRLLSLF